MQIHKKIFFSIVILSFLTTGINVVAQDKVLLSPGITPDNPFYIFKTIKENIQLFFTFGAENKAKQYLHLSEIRLAEYQKMLEKGKTEIAQKTLEKYEKQLSMATEKIQELKNSGKNVENISNQLVIATSKNVEIIQNNLQSVPAPIKENLEKVLEEMNNKIEAIKPEVNQITPGVTVVPSSQEEATTTEEATVNNDTEKTTEEINTTPSITLLSPNGGEILNEGNDYLIKWQSNNLKPDEKIIIELSGADGRHATIATVSANQNSYLWTVDTSDAAVGYNNLNKHRVFAVLISEQIAVESYDKWKISIFTTGTKVNNSSDGYFKIEEAKMPLIGFKNQYRSQSDFEVDFEGATIEFCNIGEKDFYYPDKLLGIEIKVRAGGIPMLTVFPDTITKIQTINSDIKINECKKINVDFNLFNMPRGNDLLINAGSATSVYTYDISITLDTNNYFPKIINNKSISTHVIAFPVESGCSDSDGGINEYVYGKITTAAGSVYNDLCGEGLLDSSYGMPGIGLREWYCKDGYPAYKYTAHREDDCLYGARMKSTGNDNSTNVLICTDSDGSDYYTKGHTTDGNIDNFYEYNDTCMWGGNLRELYCENGYLKQEDYTCPNGCLDGSCIK